MQPLNNEMNKKVEIEIVTTYRNVKKQY